MDNKTYEEVIVIKWQAVSREKTDGRGQPQAATRFTVEYTFESMTEAARFIDAVCDAANNKWKEHAQHVREHLINDSQFQKGQGKRQ